MFRQQWNKRLALFEGVSPTFRENVFPKPITIAVLHIAVMQFLSNNISPAGLSLSFSLLSPFHCYPHLSLFLSRPLSIFFLHFSLNPSHPLSCSILLLLSQRSLSGVGVPVFRLWFGESFLQASAFPLSQSQLNSNPSGSREDEVFLLLWSMKEMTVYLKICWWLHLRKKSNPTEFWRVLEAAAKVYQSGFTWDFVSSVILGHYSDTVHMRRIMGVNVCEH